MASKTTVSKCLQVIGANQSDVLECNTVDDEFVRIKRVYFKQILRVHPDKGGNASDFRAVQAAWEVLRDLYDKGKVHAQGFTYYFSGVGAAQEADQRAPDDDEGPPPSASWYEEAAAENVPPYKVEAAKSDRSKCVTKSESIGCRHGQDPLIAKGDVRFGSLDLESGGYGRWHHLTCWRIPASIWLGLPDPDVCLDSSKFLAAIVAMQHIAFIGFAELSSEDQDKVVEYFMAKENYARLTKNSKSYTEKKKNASSSGAGGGGGGGGASRTGFTSGGVGDDDEVQEVIASGISSYKAPSSALVSSSSAAPKFVMPRPGFNGAQAGAFVNQTFVLTGVFPEVGGGAGLNLGKDRVRDMIESFGGRVTKAVSGKTSYVVVGSSPGASKVSAARSKNIPTPDLQGLKTVLETPGLTLADAPQATIKSFSKGYKGNGLGALKDIARPENEIEDDNMMDADGDGDGDGGGGDGGGGGSSSKKAKKAPKPKAAKKLPVVKKAAPIVKKDGVPPKKATASKKRSRATNEKEEEKEEQEEKDGKGEVEEMKEEDDEPIQIPIKRAARAKRVKETETAIVVAEKSKRQRKR
jgi:hypothetical protein